MTETPITLGAVLLWAVPILLAALGVVAGLLIRQTLATFREEIGKLREEITELKRRVSAVETAAAGAMPRADCLEAHDRLLDQVRRESAGAAKAHEDILAALDVAKEAVRLAERDPR